ncbi:LacI family DNA-binding transcriptional regulator [Streptomyces sp. NPDC005799]|uniref:LacI family DNA-binding transcriptional regulator n=1 Tax=Streptomyces sp. NPDC005799 TaxID=3154678 RepID=UPI0033F248B9
MSWTNRRCRWVNEDAAARVRSVVNRLGYVPASPARNLQAGPTSVIGLLTPDISNTFFAELAKGAEDTAPDLGYGLILCNTGFDADREDRYLGMIRSRFIDGMVYASGAPPSHRRPEALIGKWQCGPLCRPHDAVEHVRGVGASCPARADRAPRRPGKSAAENENEKVQAENQRLAVELARSHKALAIQEKAHELLELPSGRPGAAPFRHCVRFDHVKWRVVGGGERRGRGGEARRRCWCGRRVGGRR